MFELVTGATVSAEITAHRKSTATIDGRVTTVYDVRADVKLPAAPSVPLGIPQYGGESVIAFGEEPVPQLSCAQMSVGLHGQILGLLDAIPQPELTLNINNLQQSGVPLTHSGDALPATMVFAENVQLLRGTNGSTSIRVGNIHAIDAHDVGLFVLPAGTRSMENAPDFIGETRR